MRHDHLMFALVVEHGVDGLVDTLPDVTAKNGTFARYAYGRQVFRRRKTSGAADAGGQGAALRKLALEVDPAALGLSASAGPAAWAVVMDTVMADGSWHCLAVLGDGTTSLYTSSSFGVIGAGTHPTVRRASDVLLRTAQSQLDLFAPTAATGSPVSVRWLFAL